MTYPNLNATEPQSGLRLIDGDFVNGNGLAGGMNRTASQLAALAGGGQPTGILNMLTTALVEISTVATAADSFQLPPALGNQVIDVVNSTATSARGYPYSGKPNDTINGAATYDIAGNKTVRFISTRPGQWFASVSA